MINTARRSRNQNPFHRKGREGRKGKTKEMHSSRPQPPEFPTFIRKRVFFCSAFAPFASFAVKSIFAKLWHAQKEKARQIQRHQGGEVTLPCRPWPAAFGQTVGEQEAGEEGKTQSKRGEADERGISRPSWFFRQTRRKRH